MVAIPKDPVIIHPSNQETKRKGNKMRNLLILSERGARWSYDEMLDECYPEVEIGHSRFSASDVLRTMDPTCYEMGFTEYVDNCADDEVFLVEGYTDDRVEDEEETEDE
jgi:hypothetical protein